MKMFFADSSQLRLSCFGNVDMKPLLRGSPTSYNHRAGDTDMLKGDRTWF